MPNKLDIQHIEDMADLIVSNLESEAVPGSTVGKSQDTLHAMCVDITYDTIEHYLRTVVGITVDVRGIV